MRITTEIATIRAIPQGIPTERPMMSPKFFPPLHLFPSVLVREIPRLPGWLIDCELIVSHDEPL